MKNLINDSKSHIDFSPVTESCFIGVWDAKGKILESNELEISQYFLSISQVIKKKGQIKMLEKLNISNKSTETACFNMPGE